jgi:hypothetical protein
MIEKINWSNFTPEQFQTYCNALLSLEISKNFVPYGARGKDNGIDGEYTGEYAGKAGKWRFQYKFHNQARKNSFSSLKTDINKDIDNNLKSEDYLIFVTNVELLPQENQQTVQDAVDKITKTGKTTHFEIWDGEKLNILALKYPILSLWLQEGTTSQLQDYKTYFQKELSANISDNYTLNNTFIARADKLNDLKLFFADEAQRFALVIGEAGIGKTRLCVEFFKDCIEPEEDWLALVLTSYSVDFDKIKKALSGKKNYIILIDDAHNYSSEIIANFKSLTDLPSENKIKVLLTSRKISVSESLKLIKEYKQETVVKVELGKLEAKYVIEIFEAELTGNRILQYVNDLAVISAGTPLLILALIKAAKNHVAIGKIREEGFLRDYIERYFTPLINEISAQTANAPIKIKEILHIFCLLEPLNVSDQNLKNQVAQNEDITLETIDFLIEKLREYGFASGKYQLSISPDYYSDVLLLQAVKKTGWLKSKTNLYSNEIQNIIKNLASIEEVNETKGTAILDNLLDDYIGLIDKADFYKLDVILSTILYVSPIKPVMALKAIEKVLGILQNSEHQHHKSLLESIKRRNYPDSRIGIVKEILKELIELGVLEDAYNIIERFYLLTGDKTMLSSAFEFDRRDSLQNYPCTKQSFAFEKLKQIFEKESETLMDFAFEGIKSFLKLTYNISRSHYFEKYKITITNYYVSENSKVKRLRHAIIDTLIELFSKTSSDLYRETSLNILLDIPREIASAKSRKAPYQGVEDIQKIIDFLLNVTSKELSPKLKNHISQQLYWYVRWQIDDRFEPFITQIQNNLNPKNLTERLLKLFKSIEESDDFDNANKVFSQDANKIIAQESMQNIANSLIEITSAYDYLPHYFYNFLEAVEDSGKQNTKELVEVLSESNSAFIPKYLGGTLRTLYFKYDEKEFYWKHIDKLYENADTISLNCILWIYSFIKEDSLFKLTKRDKDLVLSIVKKSISETNYQAAFALANMLHVDKEQVLDILKEFLSYCSQRDADHVFSNLNKSQFIEIRKDLLLNHTFRFSLSYEIERALNTVLQQDGINVVLKYIMGRMEYSRKKIKAEKTLSSPDPVPSTSTNRILTGIDEDTRVLNYSEVLKWFVSHKFEPLETLYRENILEYFLPFPKIVPQITELYLHIYQDIETDAQKMRNAAASLAVFKSKNQDLIDLVVKLHALASKNFGADSEAFKRIQSECFSAITSAGVKSGTPGKPFPFDLALKDLLADSLTRYRSTLLTSEFLSKILKSVERDINDAIEEEEEW